jgi:hypothetical protein
LKPRTSWVICLLSIIAAGILSRTVHTGLAIFDKYLGDALYAAMVYAILRLLWRTAALALPAMAIMTVIELFQLTMVPARMLTSQHLIVRICARLMGTEFSFLDLLAYGVGIGCIYLLDRRPKVDRQAAS